MIKLMKCPMALEISLVNDSFYFDPARSTLIFGNINITAAKKVCIKSFEVSLISTIDEMMVATYQLSTNVAQKKKIQTSQVINGTQKLDLNSVNKGASSVPFEFMADLKYESVCSNYVAMRYNLKVEAVTVGNRKIEACKPVQVIKLVCLKDVTHVGRIYYNQFDYELSIPNRLFICNPFSMTLCINPVEPEILGDNDIPIVAIEAYLIQNFHFISKFHYINDATKKVEILQKPMNQSFRLRLDAFQEKNWEKRKMYHKLRSDISLEASYLDDSCSNRYVHPCYKLGNFESTHQIAVVVVFEDGTRCRITHGIDIHGCNDIDGSCHPPSYFVAKEDKIIISERPPSYNKHEAGRIDTRRATEKGGITIISKVFNE